MAILPEESEIAFRYVDVFKLTGGCNLLDMTTLMIRSLAAGRRAQASPQLGNMIGLPRSTGMDLGAENPSSLQAPGRANRLHT